MWKQMGNKRLWFAGIALCVVLLVALAVWLLEMRLFDGISGETVEGLLPKCGRSLLFTVSTAFAAEAISLPFCLALASGITLIAPEHIRERLENLISGLEAIPAVVFGYMSLRFYVPHIASPWWAVTVTLLLMGLMTQTLDFLKVNGRQTACIERARALGADRREVLLLFVFPQVKKSYCVAAIGNFIRNLSEGVAILLVLSYYDTECDTLSTALMRALGVTGEAQGRLWWVVVLVLLLFLLVEFGNYLLSAVTEGGQHGEKKTA